MVKVTISGGDCRITIQGKPDEVGAELFALSLEAIKMIKSELKDSAPKSAILATISGFCLEKTTDIDRYLDYAFKQITENTETEDEE